VGYSGSLAKGATIEMFLSSTAHEDEGAQPGNVFVGQFTMFSSNSDDG